KKRRRNKMDEEKIIGENGTVSVEDQVIFQYVSDEVLKFDGVSRLVGGITESFAKNIFGRDTDVQGIKVNRDGNEISIDIHLIAYYGVNIPQMAFDIQNSVKEVVEAYTGLSVSAINIGVEGIDKRKQQ
ncbi:Asp23/Gls24 family envelope stress response protein, partial [Mobilibacterium timonense]|uniref:Asp23/Gls24 family envelope stress response protein n=2 Tax=Mobilibacterium timonense TaxID=1871012 RepID=UPI003A8F7630